MVRWVPAAAALALAGVLAGCSGSTAGTGTGEFGGPSGPAPTSAVAPTSTASGSPAARDPRAVAKAVEIRSTDLPLGWRFIDGSRTGNDSLNWAVACAREAEVPVGTLPSAETPDFSPDGSVEADQVGTATGLFDAPAQAAAYVAALRTPEFGVCMGKAAMRLWPDAFRSVPAFRSGPFRVPTAGDAAGISTVAVQADGKRLTFQFFAIRVGPIVTMLNTSWVGAVDVTVINTAASEVGARMRRA